MRTTPSFFSAGRPQRLHPCDLSVAVTRPTQPERGGAPARPIFDIESGQRAAWAPGNRARAQRLAGAIKLYRAAEGRSTASCAPRGGTTVPGYEAGRGSAWKDILSRAAFRWSDRDGFVNNHCGGLPAEDFPFQPDDNYLGIPLATCRMFYPLQPAFFPASRFTGVDVLVPARLPKRVNDLHNWAARGTLRFEPTLENSWLAGVRLEARRVVAALASLRGGGSSFISTTRYRTGRRADAGAQVPRPRALHLDPSLPINAACAQTDPIAPPWSQRPARTS